MKSHVCLSDGCLCDCSSEEQVLAVQRKSEFLKSCLTPIMKRHAFLRTTFDNDQEITAFSFCRYLLFFIFVSLVTRIYPSNNSGEFSYPKI